MLRQPAADLLGDLVERHLTPGARRTLDREVVAVVRVVLEQRPDDQRVDRHPDRPAPVGVAAEHAAVGLRRQVRHPIVLVADTEHVRMLLVVPGDGADAVRAQELVLVEHPGQHATQLRFVQDRREQAVLFPALCRVLDERASARGARRGTAAAEARTSGYFFRSSPSNTVTAQSGSRPTIERTFSRSARPSGSLSTS